MATKYTTRDGDTVDSIAWAYYGSTSNKETEAVLTANNGLADYGTVLPAGIVIVLPDIPAPAKGQGIRLWD